MLILSTTAVSRGSNENLILTIGVLLFYLALWLILGIFIIPSIIKKIRHLMNNETLLIVTLAICFGMVWLADAIGFSAALGAFMAGSLLAGTSVAGRTEKLIAPCKDLFVAVFFVSVGFLVDPVTLFAYAIPILILIVATILGKIFFLTGAYLLTRQSIHTAVHGAFAQTQIGEFSFVLAALGLSLGVTGDFLYPIIVAVAVITTLTTPFILKTAPPFVAFLEKHLPERLLLIIADNSRISIEEENNRSRKRETWNRCLKHYFSRTALYTLLIAGIIFLGYHVLLPFALSYFPYAFTKIIVMAFLYLCLLPFLPQLLISHDPDFTALWLQDRFNKLPLLILMGLRFAITLAALIIIPILFYSTTLFWLLFLTIPLAFLAARSKKLRGSYLRIAAKFMANLNEHQLREKSEVKDLLWMESTLLVDTYKIPEGSVLANRSLQNLQWGRTLHLNIIKIIHGKKHINLPTGKDILSEGDILYIFGAENAVNNFRLIYGDTAVKQLNRENVSLYQYIMHQDDFAEKDQLFCYGAMVHKNSPFVGKSIRDSGLRKECNCFIIGVERELYPIRDPSPNFILRTNDIIWLLGSVNTVSKLIQDEAILNESYTLGKTKESK
jgi:CPA2 family monovalent cation:H+ antiporter-2